MALKASLTAEEFAEIAEPLQEHYTQDGDGYKLDTDIAAPENVTGLKSALEAERKNVRDAKKLHRETVEKYKDIDPEKAREAMTKIQEIDDAAAVEAGKFEELKTRLIQEKEDGIAGVKTELGTKLSKAESALKREMIDNQIIAAAGIEKAFPASVITLTKLVREYVDLDDEYNPVIKDGHGTTIAELMQNLKATDEFGIFFEADVTTGSGGSTQARGGTGKTAAKKASEMSSKEKAAFITANGLEAWKALIAAG